MPVQYRLFRLDSTEGSAEVLNRFLRQHRSVRVERNFVALPEPHYVVLVEYDLGRPEPLHERPGQTDFEAAQSGASAARYAALKEWRAHKAKTEGLPAFHILKNADMDILAGMKNPDLGQLKAIPGFGPSRIQKYGEEILGVLHMPLE